LRDEVGIFPHTVIECTDGLADDVIFSMTCYPTGMQPVLK